MGYDLAAQTRWCANVVVPRYRSEAGNEDSRDCFTSDERREHLVQGGADNRYERPYDETMEITLQKYGYDGLFNRCRAEAFARKGAIWQGVPFIRITMECLWPPTQATTLPGLCQALRAFIMAMQSSLFIIFGTG